MTDILDFVKAEGLRRTAQLVFEPSSAIDRVMEFLDVSENVPQRIVTIDLSLPATPVLVPIAFPRRDVLIDTVLIDQTPGVNPTPLSRGHTVEVMRVLLLYLGDTIDMRPLPKDDVLTLCAQIPTLPKQEALALVRLLRQAMSAATSEPLTSDQVSFFQTLQFFCHRHPIFIACNTLDPVLRIRYTIKIGMHDIRLHAFLENLRTRTGRLPDDLLIEIPLANRCQSYHFHITIPPRFFIPQIECFTRRSRSIAKSALVRPWELRDYKPGNQRESGLRPHIGTSAHVHLSDTAQKPGAERGLLLRVHMSEVPFGQLGSAVIRLSLAIIAIILVTIFGPTVVTSPSTAVVSLLAAMPALLGVTSLVSTAPAERSPLLARAGSILASLSAIATSVVFVGWATRASIFFHRHPHATSYGGTAYTRTTLLIIAMALIVMLLLCIRALTLNLRSYRGARVQFLEMRRRDDVQPA